MPTGPSAANTPTEDASKQKPRTVLESSSRDLKSGIRAKNDDAINPWVRKASVTPKRAREISCDWVITVGDRPYVVLLAPTGESSSNLC